MRRAEHRDDVANDTYGLPCPAIRAGFGPPRCPLPDGAWRAVGAAPGLSPRQIQVAKGFLDGLDEAAIGAAIGIADSTVHSHVQRRYRKIGARSRSAALLRMFAVFVAISTAEDANEDAAECEWADRRMDAQGDAVDDLRVGHIGGRLSLRHKSTSSSIRAVPTHITLSAPPQ